MARERLSPDQRVAWLRLSRADNVGPATFRKLINRFGTAAKALDALPDLVRKGGARVARIPSLAETEDEIAAIEAIGGRLVALGEADYPPHLTHVSGAPPLLTVMGGDILARPATVAIVGARNASTAGHRMTRILARELGEAGYVVVSGLARGIDATAHAAALETGTIGVLAGGLDRLYPAENVPLAQSIVDAGGALITEMPMGWEARARDFPRRNRLVSGLSLGVVIVEAAKRSGSLITARLALEQNREVFAVPGSPLDPRAEGGNALLRQGATLVTATADILEELVHADPARTGSVEEPGFNFDTDPDADLSADPSPDERTALLSALSVTPTAIDDLIVSTGIAPGAMQMLLLELELAGRLDRAGGQLVALRV